MTKYFIIKNTFHEGREYKVRDECSEEVAKALGAEYAEAREVQENASESGAGGENTQE